AEHYQIDSKEFKRIYSIASRIYEESKIDAELLGLITYTNKKANKNPIGFMLHILKRKEEIYKDGGDASIIDNEYKSDENKMEVIPEWNYLHFIFIRFIFIIYNASISTILINLMKIKWR